MYQVSVRQHFDAAHYLRNYQGKCEQLHGHRFEVVVALQTEELDEVGLAFDFSKLKKYMKDIVGKFDHICLNDIPPFDEINPSSENIAVIIYRELQSHFVETGVSISRIEVWESPESCATYVPQE